MKRSGPLRRASGIKSYTTLHRVPLTRRTRLRQVSAKRSRENRERTKVLAALREQQGDRCGRCGRAGPLDGHEIRTRARGGSITDPDNIVMVCRTCHDWITGHPVEAAEAGWVKWSWDA